MRKRSKKGQALDRKYAAQRQKFLKHIPQCEVKGCFNHADDVHHKRGRVGENYLNMTTWLAVCRPCHQHIELNPIWAKEQGYSESRLNKVV